MKQYKDREEAAVILCNKLEHLINRNDADYTMVMAIPRGGVVLGNIIASYFNVKLDIIISKKIGSPDNPELAIGSIMHDGSFYPNTNIIEMLHITDEYIDQQSAIKIQEIRQKLLKFRRDVRYDLKDKNIILVDDGIATGATIINAIKWIRNQKPRGIIVAIPVGPNDTINLVSKLADYVIVDIQSHSFSAVGEFYHDFCQVTDDLVSKIMSRYK